MPLRYRDNMTAEERAALLAECDWLDACYAAADEARAAAEVIPADDEEYECFDPIRDGWVDRNTGRP